jgi:ABC-type glycerol-3-phosphate transport system permease component
VFRRKKYGGSKGNPSELKTPLGVTVAAVIGAVFMGLPLVYMVVNALKPLDELFIFPPPLWVRRPTLDNFRDLVLAAESSVVPFSRYIFNSLFVSTAIVAVSILIGAMFAYPLAKHTFPGKRLFDFLIVASLMFTTEVIQIPRYLIVNSLGMIDTYWALIIPSLAYSLGVFLMRQFLVQFPNVLIEAARMDGANEWQVFTKVVLSFIKPALATTAVLAFQAAWNDTYGPMIFLRSEAMKTLPVAMQTIMSNAGIARVGANNAAGLIMVIPPILVFLLMQANVLRTFAYSGIKA